MIVYAPFQHDNWHFYIAKTNQGLCYVSGPDETEEEVKAWLRKKYPGEPVQENEAALAPYKKEFEDYFSGSQDAFKLPVDAKGTPFQQDVWQALSDIPYGETCSYGDIADRIGRPKAVRAVGGAIGANPTMINVPCHRVIGKNGSLTGFGGGLDLKRYLLEVEQR